MGACYTKLTITDTLFLELKSNPNDKLLLMLQVHWDLYDKESQKKINELCQLSISTDRSLHFEMGAVADIANKKVEDK